ncbi:hypothetical protein DTO169E5_6635 [Paecilomyces variotii]|nr:hypothetical protein DTO169E5_6635 [Paecilomyces variotii]
MVPDAREYRPEGSPRIGPVPVRNTPLRRILLTPGENLWTMMTLIDLEANYPKTQPPRAKRITYTLIQTPTD